MGDKDNLPAEPFGSSHQYPCPTDASRTALPVAGCTAPDPRRATARVPRRRNLGSRLTTGHSLGNVGGLASLQDGADRAGP